MTYVTIKILGIFLEAKIVNSAIMVVCGGIAYFSILLNKRDVFFIKQVERVLRKWNIHIYMKK